MYARVRMVLPRAALRRILLAAAPLVIGGCCSTRYNEVSEATARCQEPSPRTDAAHNSACDRCCRGQKTSMGTVWSYGTCKCFKGELYYKPPVFF